MYIVYVFREVSTNKRVGKELKRAWVIGGQGHAVKSGVE